MLQTGVSLVVDDGSHTNIDDASIGQKEFYMNNNDSLSEEPIRRRPGTRKRKRRPQQTLDGSASPPSGAEHTQYWRGRVDDETAPTAVTSTRENVRSNIGTRRRKQPAAIREPLAALEKEQKLYEIRDKQRQKDVVLVAANNNHDKSYRRPYSQAKKELQAISEVAETPGSVEGTTLSGKSSVNLKHILKNAGGLSLSEILQQQNLSLDDLLKGKKNALLALQTTATSPAAQKPDVIRPSKPVRRIPNAYLGTATTTSATTTNSNDESEEQTKHIQSFAADNDDAQQTKNKLKFPTLQRLKLFGSSSRATTSQYTATSRRRELMTSSTTPTPSTRVPIYKKRQQQRSTLKPPSLFKVSTAATTAKEIASSMETLTTVDNQTEDMENGNSDEIENMPESVENDEQHDIADSTEAEESKEKVFITTTQETPTSRRTSTTRRRTSAFTSTTTVATSSTSSSSSSTRSKSPFNIPSRIRNSYRDRLQESNSIENEKQITHSATNESGEFNDTDDLENFFEESNTKSASTVTEDINTARIDRDRYTAKPISYMDTIPDFDGVDDRTDLLELIEDRRSGNRLFKVLQQRNMTLEELIEHRKRGSSQLHLATLVQNSSRFFPGQKVVLNDNMDIVTAFENFPHFNLMDLKSVKPDDIKTDSQGSSYFTSIIDIEPTDEIYKDGSGKGALSRNRLERQRRFRGAARYRSRN